MTGNKLPLSSKTHLVDYSYYVAQLQLVNKMLCMKKKKGFILLFMLL